MLRMALARSSALGLLALVAAGPAPQQPPAAQQNNPSFNLVNHTKSTIKQAFATPSSVTRWGRDVLGDAIVPANGTFPVRLPLGDCVYDVRVFYANGEKAEKRKINTCSVDSVTFTATDAASPDVPAPATPPVTGGRTETPPPAEAPATPAQPPQESQPNGRQLELVIFNLSKTAITSVYASPTGVDSWGDDRLGNNTLPANGNITLPIQNIGKCLYDVRFVYADDSKFEKRKIDMCNGPVTLRVH